MLASNLQRDGKLDNAIIVSLLAKLSNVSLINVSC